MRNSRPSIFRALLAASLFGASTPVAKLLLHGMGPILVAGLFYLGSGIGLSLYLTIRSFKPATQEHREASLKRSDMPWLAGVILFGGVLGPLLLMLGLGTVSASAASLFLNLETVMTVLLAWFVFHENVGRRVAFGMVAIVFGDATLAIGPSAKYQFSLSSLSIAGACLCWAIDNNLTRKVSQVDPLQIAASKGVIAGISNCSLALLVMRRDNQPAARC